MLLVVVPLQAGSRSKRPRESRQRSGLFPRLTRHGLGLLVSADPCLSDAASSSLSMLRLNSCSFSDDASFSLHTKGKNTFEHMTRRNKELQVYSRRLCAGLSLRHRALTYISFRCAAMRILLPSDRAVVTVSSLHAKLS